MYYLNCNYTQLRKSEINYILKSSIFKLLKDFLYNENTIFGEISPVFPKHTCRYLIIMRGIYIILSYNIC